MSKLELSMGELESPYTFRSKINVDSKNEINCLRLLEKMVLIRKIEIFIGNAKRDGLIGCPVHLGVGQEAIAVGVSENLTKKDRVFGAHRSHSHLLALGSDVRKLFAEILGKATGHSKGMGGSMHLWDKQVGFYGSVPIVAGTVPLAVGAGMAAALQNTNDVAIAYLGDGALEEGVVQESLNLASVQNTPVIFVVENNFFSSHMHISIRQSGNATYRYAIANNIPYKLVDGNNVLEVAKESNELIESARNGLGPGFLEAITYRWYGHVDWREDIDVGICRAKEDVENWRKKDPIKRLYEGMIEAGIWSSKSQDELEKNVSKEIEIAWDLALKDPYPASDDLLNYVYRKGED